MRIEDDLYNRLGRDAIATIDSVVTSRIIDFSSISRTLDLDPKRDYRYENLSGVDFTGCDLSGYDFTGADLSGTFGINVRYDKSTKFTSANLEASLFSSEVECQNFFAKSPRWTRELQRVKNGYWADVAIWVASSVKNEVDREANLRIAMEVYRHTKSAVVRSNILYFCGPLFRSRELYRDFLLSILSLPDQKAGVITSGLFILSNVLFEDRVACDLLFSFVPSENFTHRRLAIRGIVRSIHYRTYRHELSELMQNEPDKLTRVYYLQQVARRLGEHTSFADKIDEISVDFLEPMNTAHLNRLALDRASLITVFEQGVKRKIKDKGEAQRLFREMKTEVERLSKEGVPFNSRWD